MVAYCLVAWLLLAAWPAVSAGENAPDQRFSRQTVIDLARQLSQSPFRPLPRAPEALTSLDYSAYRQINYQQDEAVWGQSPTRFSVQLFAPGFLYDKLVNIDLVENGRARPLTVSRDSFRVPDPALAELLAEVGKYAGMRLHYPLNKADYDDEFLVFQGASFFRGVSRGQLYGLSARGLAIDVAEPHGEEHPVFRRFWIERPAADQDAMVVHALLDSERVTGAYRFGIYPGQPLRMDVEVTLFPRVYLPHVGLAPLTSMFMHGPAAPGDRPDYRPAVHDSEGLAIKRANGERLWRPLSNPHTLQASAFLDHNPAGFGLIQRNRDFNAYQDLEASYHRRPSAWVEPLGDWGPGQVQLVEIPSDSEANDNMVAYWRPADGLPAGEPYRYAYRLTWPDDAPLEHGLAPVVRSAGGDKLFSEQREVMIDWANSVDCANLSVDAGISEGRIIDTTLQTHPGIAGCRAFIAFDPGAAQAAELRVMLLREDGRPAGETWLYRWLNDG
ncbi:glucan biosynthesis protein G [Parahaliea aestuarii]|uniref:Glucan biosynthesis protein G n=1 Tax=Parahaliea aestuarii TaxID=1852021 RepID=A0A5C8ZTN2_9GAMM|nr:glucan biosynthesis protein G [Parahaliea aestuarii]